MGKRPKTVKSRAADSDASAGQPKTMHQVTTPSQGLTPPQLTALVALSVGVTTFVSLRRAAIFEGVGSSLCDNMYAGDEGGCTESDLFFVLLRYHKTLVWLALYSLLMLLCWTEPPLLQRLNHCLCASPVSATMAGVTAHMGALNPRHAMTTGLSFVALFVLTNSSYCVGMVPWQRPSANLHNGSLVLLIAAALGYAVFLMLVGPDGFSDFAVEDISDGSRAQLMFIAIDFLNMAVLGGFVLFFLDDVRKRVMMFFIGFAHLGQIFYHLPEEKDHLQGVDTMNNVLFGLAVMLLFFSVLPSQTKVKSA